MKTYLIKQKLRLGGERFAIRDDRDQIAYQVEGSFMKIPKSFVVFNGDGKQVSQITKTVFSILPQFEIQMQNGSRFYIRKKWTFFRDRYSFDNLGLKIQGNIWDLDFKLLDDDDHLIADISKEIFHLTSTYQVTVFEDHFADLVISLCVAIDYVEALEARSN